jgi:lipoprotein signal peptidase
MARRRTAGATVTPGAGPAPRPRGHRSLVTKRDLQAYRRRLEAELAELHGQCAELEESTEASLADATGEVGFDEEFADAGSFTFERERDLSLVGNARDLIDKVEQALARIDADRFGRYLVVSNLAGRPPLDVIGSFVQLRYTTNSGGAFSLLTGAPLFFGVMAIVIIGGIVYAWRRTQPLSMLVVLGLILGGALGNLTDRLLRGEGLLRGEVVDFVKVGIWPVFNLADSCIVVGGLLLAILLGRSERDRDQAPADRDRA